MNGPAKGVLDLREMETLAAGQSFIHRLDSRGKILLAFIFSVLVASFDRYDLTGLIPFFSFPLFTLAASGIPLSFPARKLLAASIFAFAIAIANPFIDRNTALTIAGIPISGGWVSFVSIMIRFTLTAGTALLLLATTGLRDLTKGLEVLGVPKLLANQLYFLCSSLFLLSDEAARMTNGRDARSFNGKGHELSTTVKLLTTLLSRSFDRAERVHTAMLSRGFDGTLPVRRKSRWRVADTAHTLIWTAAFAAFRFIGFS